MNDYQDGQENAPLLELRGVSQRYSQGTFNLDVLIDANLTVLAGELKALVGPSGSGKSTLLNIAGLLELPDAGDVFIGGVNASKLSHSKRGLLRRNDIGFVFQFHRLLPEFSAMENIMIPQMLSGLDRGESQARADQLLGMVGTAAGMLFCWNIDAVKRAIERLSGAELFAAEIYFLSNLPAKVNPQEVLMVVLMALGLSFLASLYPAWRASRIAPAEALRYE